MELPKEYFLGNFFDIQNTRKQKFGDCWSNALVSAIGDIFSIKNNLQPVYFSAPYVTSMQNDVCRYFIKIGKNEDICNYTLYDGGKIDDMCDYMRIHDIGFKLESCFPYDETIKYLLAFRSTIFTLTTLTPLLFRSN